MKSDLKSVRQYGLWSSPLSPAAIAGGLRVSDVSWDDYTGALVWLEERSGHGVLVCAQGDDAPRDLTDTISVRARVGYGGGDFAAGGGAVFFVDGASGRIYRQPLAGGIPKAVTPAFGRAAAPTLSPDKRWLVYVHSADRVDRLVVADADGDRWPQVLTSGHDFYMQPAWSPDGRRLAWVAWDHPNMPWDGTNLYVADVEYTETGPVLRHTHRIAGGHDVSTLQPVFSPNGRELVYVTDEGGMGVLAARDLEAGSVRTFPIEGADLLRPAWIQGVRVFALSPDGWTAAVAAPVQGSSRAFFVDLVSGAVAPVAALEAYDFVEQPAIDPRSGAVAAIASGPAIPLRVVTARAGAEGSRVVRRTSTENLDVSTLSVPQPRSWASTDGETVHGLFYPPASSVFTSAGRPPLVVYVHGGPTAMSSTAWNPTIQFLTTRGYAVLAVNYRGSAGYGREYRQKLRGNWGVHDVEDSVSGLRALAEAGEVDGARAAILGGSAGGFTVLQTMISHPEAFTAGVCLYGVANQFTLAAETHKFEERYSDSLLGPLPDAAPIYRERSPELHADRIRRPLAIFQGEIDEVVPQAQSDAIVAALARNGTPHEYHVFAGEGHGWRKRETIEAYHAALERFLKQYLVFT